MRAGNVQWDTQWTGGAESLFGSKRIREKKKAQNDQNDRRERRWEFRSQVGEQCEN